MEYDGGADQDNSEFSDSPQNKGDMLKKVNESNSGIIPSKVIGQHVGNMVTSVFRCGTYAQLIGGLAKVVTEHGTNTWNKKRIKVLMEKQEKIDKDQREQDI